MFDEATLESLQQKLADCREANAFIQELLAASYELEKALAKYAEAERKLLESRGAQTLARLLSTADDGRTNVDVYEEILLNAGAPMHVKEIAAEANRRGVLFRGKSPIEVQVRNSLAGSKRFENLGSNTWWFNPTAFLDLQHEDDEVQDLPF